MVLDTIFISRKVFTQEEFAQWLKERPPTDINYYELVGGKIFMSPPAGWPQGKIATNISTSLKLFVRQGGLGEVLDSSAGYELPSSDTVAPDVSFISRQRLAAGPAPEPGRFLRIVPTLVVEILSRATRQYDLTEKRRVYEKNGVEEYWIVDPVQERVDVLVLRGQTLELAGTYQQQDIIASVVLMGFSLPVQDVFA